MNILRFIASKAINFRLSRYRFAMVDGEQELTKIYRLRYEVFCQELNFLPVDSFSDRQEKDQYDLNAVHFAAYDRATVVGTVRLILSNGVQLPTEKVFDVKPFLTHQGRVAEISRFVVKKRYRGKWVGVGLISQLIAYGLKNNLEYYLITNSIIHQERYLALGFFPISGPYKYPLVNDKYPAVTMLCHLPTAYNIIKRTQPILLHLAGIDP